MAQPVIIDTHLHLYEYRKHGLMDKEGYEIWEYGTKPDVRYSAYAGDVEDALKAIGEAAASKAVVVNLFGSSLTRAHAVADLPGDLDESQKERALRHIDSTLGDILKESNEWVCRVGKTNPQLVPFIAVDPSVLSTQDSLTHVRDMVSSHGAKGIKVHPALQQFYMGDDRMRPIYEACIELDIPIVTHSGPSRGGDQYAEPRAFADVLRDYPRLRLVIAHMGGGAWRQLLELAQTFPQATFDCCEIMEWCGGTNAATDQQLAKLIKDVGPERVMMGSDWPWYDIDHSVEIVMELPILAQEEKEAILGANAQRILRL